MVCTLGENRFSAPINLFLGLEMATSLRKLSNAERFDKNKPPPRGLDTSPVFCTEFLTSQLSVIFSVHRARRAGEIAAEVSHVILVFILQGLLGALCVICLLNLVNLCQLRLVLSFNLELYLWKSYFPSFPLGEC